MSHELRSTIVVKTLWFWGARLHSAAILYRDYTNSGLSTPNLDTLLLITSEPPPPLSHATTSVHYSCISTPEFSCPLCSVGISPRPSSSLTWLAHLSSRTQVKWPHSPPPCPKSPSWPPTADYAPLLYMLIASVPTIDCIPVPCSGPHLPSAASAYQHQAWASHGKPWMEFSAQPERPLRITVCDDTPSPPHTPTYSISPKLPCFIHISGFSLSSPAGHRTLEERTLSCSSYLRLHSPRLAPM